MSLKERSLEERRRARGLDEFADESRDTHVHAEPADHHDHDDPALAPHQLLQLDVQAQSEQHLPRQPFVAHLVVPCLFAVARVTRAWAFPLLHAVRLTVPIRHGGTLWRAPAANEPLDLSLSLSIYIYIYYY